VQGAHRWERLRPAVCRGAALRQCARRRARVTNTRSACRCRIRSLCFALQGTCRRERLRPAIGRGAAQRRGGQARGGRRSCLHEHLHGHPTGLYALAGQRAGPERRCRVYHRQACAVSSRLCGIPTVVSVFSRAFICVGFVG
jgi:hypothetical protein